MSEKVERLFAILKLCSPGLILHDAPIIARAINNARAILKKTNQRHKPIYFAIVNLDNSFRVKDLENITRKQIFALKDCMILLDSEMKEDELQLFNDILFESDLKVPPGELDTEDPEDPEDPFE